MTLAMQNHKVLGSSRTVLDWVRATLLDLEVEINARKNTAGKKNMTDDRDITERLEDPSYDGAIYMRQDAAKEIRRLREYSSKQALDIVTLGQEVGRLREALEPFACAADDLDRENWGSGSIEGSLAYITAEDCRTARAALSEKDNT